MEFTDNEQMTLDLDWFATDSAGHLAHFASAGRPLPVSVAASKEENSLVREFFRSLPATRSACEVDSELAKFVVFENSEQRSRYLNDFQSMGSRGLYSYDTPLSEGQKLFFRVCSPQEHLTLSDLPSEVAAIVQRTVFPGRFANSSTISLGGIS
jgi:hypothetical protein